MAGDFTSPPPPPPSLFCSPLPGKESNLGIQIWSCCMYLVGEAWGLILMALGRERGFELEALERWVPLGALPFSCPWGHLRPSVVPSTAGTAAL